MFNEIKSSKDIKNFLTKTNWLHDGYIVGVQYTNHGITKIENGHSFDPAPTKLILQILVTSIWDTVIEIEFEHLAEWQIKDNQWDITDTSVVFKKDKKDKWFIWSDNNFTNMDDLKNRSYAIAKSMKWRVVE